MPEYPLQKVPNVPSQTTLNKTIGAVVIGTLVSAVLSAITTVQWRYYYVTYKSDPRWIRWMVAVLWWLDNLQLIFQALTAYHYCITHFAEPEELKNWSWQIAAVIFLEPWSGAICQLYLARMFWMLNTKRHLIPSLIMATIAVVGLGLGMWTGIGAFWIIKFTELREQVVRITGWHVCSTTASLLVTVTVTYALWTSRTGFDRTDQVVSRLALYTVSNGGLMCAFALANTITYFEVTPPSIVFISANFVLTKLYSNTVLASLNRRSLFKRPQRNRPGDLVFQNNPAAIFGLTSNEVVELSSTPSLRFAENTTQSPVTKMTFAAIDVHVAQTITADDGYSEMDVELAKPSRAKRLSSMLSPVEQAALETNSSPTTGFHTV